METSKSVLELFLRAYALGLRLWNDYSSVFSRREFTRPRLFACLVVREALKLSYRKTEAFLGDVPHWLAEIGLARVPDHSTLWRAFGLLLKKRRVDRALDLLADDEQQVLDAELAAKPLTIDATCYEPRHRSGHYDRVWMPVLFHVRDSRAPIQRPAHWPRPRTTAPSGSGLWRQA